MEERMMMTSDITPVMGFTQLDSVLKKKNNNKDTCFFTISVLSISFYSF